MVALEQLLAFERAGYVRTPGLLRPNAVHELTSSLRGLYEDRQVCAAEQKTRVLCGEEALADAQMRGGSSPTARLRECRRKLDALPEGSVPFFQLFNFWRESDAVARLVRSPKLAGTAAELLGVGDAGRPSRLRLYQDSLFVKRPGDGRTNWHADLAMAPLDTNQFVTVWLPLQRVPAHAQGGTSLLYAPGSHRDVALPFWRGDPRSVGDVSHRYAPPVQEDAFEIGDAAWHHGWTLHCAPPNALPGERMAFTVSYFVDGATRLPAGARPDDEDGESWAAWVADVKPGRVAQHELLPVVWPAAGARGEPRGRPRRSARGGAKPQPGRAPPSGSKARRVMPGARGQAEVDRIVQRLGLKPVKPPPAPASPAPGPTPECKREAGALGVRPESDRAR
jgi:ectoine hydroxylase-related dioxygenase (phytanoyl-CoA dioxygenase family)